MEWLKIVSKKLEKAGEEPLNIHNFEVAMDRLEKESFFQVIIFEIKKLFLNGKMSCNNYSKK